MSEKKPSTANPAPATIAASTLPPRVRQIVGKLFEQASRDLVTSLNTLLPEYEQQLFRLAEQARNNNRQAEHFANLRTFQRNRLEFVPHFVFALEAELAAIRAPVRDSVAPPPPAEFRTLTLVEDAVMDQEIVLQDIARRHEGRAATPLLLLGQRFGVLAGQPALEPAQLPVGPQALCRMLKLAGETLELDIESQLLLYRTFDHKVMHDYATWAETLNHFLAREGILPGLVFLPRRVRATDHPSVRGGSESPASARPLTSWQGQEAGSSWPGLRPEDAAGLPDVVDVPEPADSGPRGEAAAPTKDLEASFATLQKLLSMRRHALAADAPGGTGAAAAGGGDDTPAAEQAAPAAALAAFRKKLVPTPDVLQTLQGLQSRGMPQRVAGRARRSIADLQKAMLAQVRANHGPQAALANADADTFELLDLLYKQIDREVQQDAPAADLLVRLQVPVVQAALRDRDFFLRPQHPARELLNTVAESGATWLADEDVDPQLVHKLHQTVETVVSEYQGDEIVFERANQDVQQHLRAAARKAELSERRQVEAARGKERLEIAKQLAAETIETALRDQQPQKFVQALLNQAWADVLTLTLLRNGESSNEWHEHLQTTLQIVAATTDESRPPDPELPARIENALTQVGYHGDEAAAIARRLSSTEEDETTSRTELTARLKARARLGEQTPAPVRKKKHERTEEEQRCYEYLRALPFGTWFEFTLNQQGDVRRQRLSWFSPVTGHTLFVNQRGQRVGDQSLDALAHLMAQGQVRVVTEDKGRLIDRAWNATLKALRNLTGTGADATTLPGGTA